MSMSWAATAVRLFRPARGRRAGRLVHHRPGERRAGLVLPRLQSLFDRMTAVYGRTVGRVLRMSAVVLMVYGGLLVLTYWQFSARRPGSSRSRTRAI